MPASWMEPWPVLMLYTRTSLMVRSGRSAGLTPAPCAAAVAGLAKEETAAADAPRNPRRELVFDIVTFLGNHPILVHSRSAVHIVDYFCLNRRHANPRHGLAPLRFL